MVRPAGPRISSMICAARSRGSAFSSKRSSALEAADQVAGASPCFPPKSRQSRSTTSARTEPSCAIAAEMSLGSSSCIMPNRRAHWSSPSAEHQHCRPAARPSVLYDSLSSFPCISHFPAASSPAHDGQCLVRMVCPPVRYPGATRRRGFVFDLGEVHHALVLSSRGVAGVPAPAVACAPGLLAQQGCALPGQCDLVGCPRLRQAGHAAAPDSNVISQVTIGRSTNSRGQKRYQPEQPGLGEARHRRPFQSGRPNSPVERARRSMLPRQNACSPRQPGRRAFRQSRSRFLTKVAMRVQFLR